MSATPTRPATIHIPAQLQPLATVAMLLERLDRLPRQASAEQYRDVARRATALLDQAAPAPSLEQMLDTFPALAELWENRHYLTSGLCRAPLEAATDAELEVAALLKRLRG